MSSISATHPVSYSCTRPIPTPSMHVEYNSAHSFGPGSAIPPADETDILLWRQLWRAFNDHQPLSGVSERFCVECGELWPCSFRQWAEATVKARSKQGH